MCLLGKYCFCPLHARTFMHTLVGSDSNLFRATTADSHQLSFSFDRRLSVSLWSIKNRCDHLMRLQCHNTLFNRCVTIATKILLLFSKFKAQRYVLFLCLILQKIFCQSDFHIWCERILLFLRNMFKFLNV
jgi:hypothetical protein